MNKLNKKKNNFYGENYKSSVKEIVDHARTDILNFAMTAKVPRDSVTCLRSQSNYVVEPSFMSEWFAQGAA